jgi:muramoyltetrapeptide carboxypeptidase
LQNIDKDSGVENKELVVSGDFFYSFIERINMFKKLSPNSIIGLVSPAWIPVMDRLTAGISYLESKEIRVKRGNNLEKIHGYFSGSDEERAEDLHQMYADPDVKMIICSRGGWGGLRIINKLDYDLIKRNPKPLVGYSDITTLQLAIWAKTGVPSFSGPMVGVEMGKGINDFTERHFWGQIYNDYLNYDLDLTETTTEILINGEVDGNLLGGCLSLVCHLLGTPFSPDFQGSILFLEDVGEQPYKIDRYFAHLKQAGVFEKIGGLILGEFIDCVDDNERSFTVSELIHNYFSQAPFPVIQNFPYGHGDVKFSMPIGVKASLNTYHKQLRVANPFTID